MEKHATRAPADARRRHYGAFYGLQAVADGAAVVLGNCQAESLRIMLDTDDLPTVRVPPIHELTADDLPYLHRLLASTRLLVSQPVRDDYRDLPLGTRQLTGRLPASTARVLVPAVRHTALYPAQAIVRIPGVAVADPPIVPYHDLRVAAQAAGDPLPALTVPTVRRAAEQSTVELRRREAANGSIVASDLFDEPEFAAMRTINHPGNPVFAALAGRVRETASLPARVVDPGRPLLNSVHAPREQVVIDTWGAPEHPDDRWMVDGRAIDGDEVRSAHARWYAEHPDRLAAVLDRHAPTLRMLAA